MVIFYQIMIILIGLVLGISSLYTGIQKFKEVYPTDEVLEEIVVGIMCLIIAIIFIFNFEVY